MYSRSYYPEAQDRMSLPDNYDGTAFMEQKGFDSDNIAEISFNDKNEEQTDEQVIATGGRASNGIGSIPILSGLFDKRGLLGGLGLSMPQIGTEEILILTTAAFLFFSKNGDRECALLLLLLIFIN